MIQFYLDEGAMLPSRAYPQDAGIDLRSPSDFCVPPHGSTVIDTGVHAIIPEGYCGLLVSKSGLNVRNSITSTGLIDSGYTGSIKVKLYNHGDRKYWVAYGDKISQLLVIPYVAEPFKIIDGRQFSEIQTERGEKGFGSSGR